VVIENMVWIDEIHRKGTLCVCLLDDAHCIMANFRKFHLKRSWRPVAAETMNMAEVSTHGECE
jgi:hypothetical protein